MSEATEAVAAEVADYARHGSWKTLEARLAMRIAAAEERGRRRGVEERDELRALLHEVETTLAGRREIEGASPATVSAIVARLAAYAVHHPALAPRDSGKVAMVKEFTREEAVAMFGPRKDRP